MKTQEVIAVLGRNLEPVRGDQVRSTLLAALAVSLAAVSVLCLLWGLLHGFTLTRGDTHWGTLALALVFTLGLAAAGAWMLFRVARPGPPRLGTWLLLGLLVIAVIGALIVMMGTCGLTLCDRRMMSGPWGTCLICIPIFGGIPFVALSWALRRAAPTQLALTGAVAGLVAGALGAAAVAFHQTGVSIAFITLGYGGPIVLCALLGALAGPRLLRW